MKWVDRHISGPEGMIPWNCLEFYTIPWSFVEFHEVMELHRILGNPMEFHGIPRTSAAFEDAAPIPRNSVEFHRIP